MKFSSKPENPIIALESTNFWAWNFWTSHLWILFKLWVIWIQVPNRSLASRLTVFIIMETSTDRFKSGRSRGSRFWEPYHSIEKLCFIEQINLYKNNFAPRYGSSNLELLDRPDLNRSVLVSIIVKTRKLSTSERFGTWIHITQSFKRIQLWEVQKFQAQKFALSRARFGFSRLELNFIKNDFYSQYLHLWDHHWT